MNIFGFAWFVGVVENRFDPLKAGRVQVRAYGYHTHDKSLIPTTDLFWAQTMMPVTAASNSNVSETPRLIEGTHVIGFYMDGTLSQQPIIMGSLPGIPQEGPNPELGFNDPTGTYPRADRLDEPDLSRLARGEDAETNPVLVAIRDSKINDIPTAKAPVIESVAPQKPNASYQHSTWSQPNNRFGGEEPSDRNYENGSKYGFNQVTESESGHYFEIDDTPGAERLSKVHRTGTFEEILADGTRVVKVVGSDYEIVVSDKKCFINGNMNVTINGDAKVLVKGNKYEEILGDHYVHVRGDRHTKIEGNDAIEIISNESKQVNGNQNIRVGLSLSSVVAIDASYSVGNNLTYIVQQNSTSTVIGDCTAITEGSYICLSKSNIDIGAAGNLNLATASELGLKSVSDMFIESDANVDFNVSGNFDHDVGGNATIDAGTITSTASGDNTVIGNKVKLNP